MKPSRRASLVEAVANVAVGYGMAVATQVLVFPSFGLWTSLADNVLIGAVFTTVSIARSYALRRLFEAIRTRGPHAAPAAGSRVVPRSPARLDPARDVA